MPPGPRTAPGLWLGQEAFTHLGRGRSILHVLWVENRALQRCLCAEPFAFPSLPTFPSPPGPPTPQPGLLSLDLPLAAAGGHGAARGARPSVCRLLEALRLPAQTSELLQAPRATAEPWSSTPGQPPMAARFRSRAGRLSKMLGWRCARHPALQSRSWQTHLVLPTRAIQAASCLEPRPPLRIPARGQRGTAERWLETRTETRVPERIGEQGITP